MSDIKYKAYSAGATSILTTELNSLANNANSAASAAVDNSSNLDFFDDAELTVTFGTNPTVNTPVEIYQIPSIDDTNYVDSGTPARNLWVGAFLVQATTSAQRLASQNIPLRPGLFKYVLRNSTGQAFPASGSVMKRRPWRLQVA